MKIIILLRGEFMVTYKEVRENGEIFLRQKMEEYFPNNQIMYIV